MDIPWLDPFASSWRQGISQGREPHAVMLAGAAGSGKRCAAAWLASCRLGLAATDSAPRYPLAVPEHADLHWLTPPEDKHTIGIEQVRDLAEVLTLTSYAGGGKVAVIDPANAMTVSAANSLLKTLEEPPGDALLVLIADRPGRLPATIFSRCQKIKVGLPSEATSLEWLSKLRPSDSWPRALKAAGNAPIAAIAALERLEETDAMARDFAALPERKASPLDVAGRWAKLESEFVLTWLCRQVQQCILRVFGGLAAPAAGGLSDSVLQRMDRRNLFCYLDSINRLRGQPAGSFNVQLNLESLLIDWAGGLPNRER